MPAGNNTHRLGLAKAFHEDQPQPLPPFNQCRRCWCRCHQAVLHLIQPQALKNQAADTFRILSQRLLQRVIAAKLGNDRLLQLLPDTRWTKEHVRAGTLQVRRQGFQALVEAHLTTTGQRGKLDDLPFGNM